MAEPEQVDHEPMRDQLARIGDRLRERQAHADSQPITLTPEPDPLAMRQIAERRWVAACPPRFRKARLADLAMPLRAELELWASEPTVTGQSLVLCGPVGVGKSHAAIAAVRGPVEDGAGLAFWPVVALLDRLRPGRDETDPYEHAVHAHLLVLDDLGAERATEWTAERLYAIVNDRWLAQRPTVVTTNMAPDKLASAVGERLASRLLGGAVVARLSGKDRRMA